MTERRQHRELDAVTAERDQLYRKLDGAAAYARDLEADLEEIVAEREQLWAKLDAVTSERDELYVKLDSASADARRLAGLVEHLRPMGLTEHLFSLTLDYPFTPRERWSPERPHPQLHELIAAKEDEYRVVVDGFLRYEDHFQRIAAHRTPGTPASVPVWINDWFPALDAMSLYAMLDGHRPRRLYEIGSGHSTMFARRALGDLGLPTTLVSIDPYPRSEIDDLCDTVVRQRVEDVELTMFEELESGDILIFDGSHRSFQNSDVTVVLTEIVPRLAAGVLVAIHDIFLPADYPPHWLERHYNEQYLVACLLLGGDRFEVLQPNRFVMSSPACQTAIDTLWRMPVLADVPRKGGLFWLMER